MRKLMVFGVSILILLLVNLVSAQEIIFDYPEEVSYGEEFEVDLEIIDFEEDEYDVKIDIIGYNKRIAEILEEDDWHSTYTYVDNIINTSQDTYAIFSLNITEEYNGTATIEVKIRDSSGKVESFPDYEIEVIDDFEEEEEEQEEEDDEISLELNWDDEDIVNGEEFEIDITAFNLEDKNYDVRLYIYDNDGNIISELYDEETNDWKSGKYYVTEILDSTRDNEIIELRIDKEHRDFEGEANIKIRIRESGTSPIVAEDGDKIDILEAEEIYEDEEEYSPIEEEPKEYKEETKQSNGVIKLGKREKAEEEKEVEETEEVKILYESSSEKVKKYAIYGLNLVLIGIIVFLLINFKNKKN